MFAVGVSIGSTILTHALAKKPDECSFLKAAAMLWHPSDWSHTSKTLPKAAFGMMDMEFGRRLLALIIRSREVLAPWFASQYDRDFDAEIN